MARWMRLLSLSLSALFVAACGCPDPTPCTGCGGAGGAGGSGGVGGTVTTTTSGNACNPGYQQVPCVPDADYVALLQECPAGVTPREMLRCDACACQASCVVDGTVHDNATCTTANPLLINATNGCVDTSPNVAPPLYVRASVADGPCVSSGEPRLNVCPIPPNVLPACDSPTVCVPDFVAGTLPLCILIETGACPSGYDNEITVQEGGTCGCTCGNPNGSCLDDPQMVVYSDNVCEQNATTITADGSTCVPLPNLTQLGSVASMPGPTCESSSSPSGGTDYTLCCLSVQ